MGLCSDSEIQSHTCCQRMQDRERRMFAAVQGVPDGVRVKVSEGSQSGGRLVIVELDADTEGEVVLTLRSGKQCLFET